MGGLIPEEINDEISSRADIVEVVQKYVQLQRTGNRWKACCPFHQEKTPSFVVNPVSNSCHCFGCGKGGSVFKFIMEMENLSFPEAARLLAREYNVMIPEPERIVFKNGEKVSSGDYNVRERLYLLHEKLALWYASNLKNKSNAKASNYFESRQMREDSAVRFMVGASLDEWDGMMKWAEREGFSLDELKLAHLVSESSKTPGKYFDFFRNRLMFPIWDEQGRVVGFSARQIDPSQGGGKYVNSMESPIFKKSKLLYGLNFARKSIGEKKYAVICEGQMDVIAMHTAGVTNAVAPQGTAFGEDQAKIIKRCFFDGSMHITLATDADSAGVKAAIRDAEILLPMGASLKVAVFPGGKDPDELLKNSGAEALVQAVEEAKDFFEFLFDFFTGGNTPSAPAEKAETAEKILKYIRLMDSEVAKDSYIQWLAGKLGLSAGTVRSEMSRLNLLKQPRTSSAGPKRNYDDGSFSGEPSISSVSSAEKAKETLPDSMKDPLLKQAFFQLLSVLLKSKKSTRRTAEALPSEMLDSGPLAVAVEILVQAEMNGEWEQAPALITKKLSSFSCFCPELEELLADAGAEEVPHIELKKEPEQLSGEEPSTPVNRQEAIRQERAEAKLRELGLPTAEQLRGAIDIQNERKRKREIAKKIVEDCIFIIKKHYYQKEIALIRKKIGTYPAGEERNKLLLQSVILTRELIKLSNPDFALPEQKNTENNPPASQETEREEGDSSSPFRQEMAAPLRTQTDAVPEENREERSSSSQEEESFEDYREIPPEDYQEEEPYMEEEEEIELPDILT